MCPATRLCCVSPSIFVDGPQATATRGAHEQGEGAELTVFYPTRCGLPCLSVAIVHRATTTMRVVNFA